MIVAAMLTACQESLEDKCAREAKAYTEKNCPAPVGENTTIDSLTFERGTHTIHYYYTLSGNADNPDVVSRVNVKKVLLDEVKNATSMKAYKDAGYNITYTYQSAKNKNVKLFEATFTKKDYQ